MEYSRGPRRPFSFALLPANCTRSNIPPRQVSAGAGLIYFSIIRLLTGRLLRLPSALSAAEHIPIRLLPSIVIIAALPLAE